MAAKTEYWEELEALPIDKLDLTRSSPAAPVQNSGAGLESETSGRVPPTSRGPSGSRTGSSSAAGGSGKPADAADHVDKVVKDALLSAKQRFTVLRFDADVESFVNNLEQTELTFPDNLSSYQRLLAHRVAQHWGLDTTTIDSSEDKVKVRATKGPNTRPPQVKLASISQQQQHQQQRWGPGGPTGDSVLLNGEAYGHEASAGLPPVSGAASVKLLTAAINKGSARPQLINSHAAPAPDRSYNERQQDYNRARSRLFANGQADSSLAGKGRGTPVSASGGPPPKSSAHPGWGRGAPLHPPSTPSHSSRRQGDADQSKAVFRNRDEEMRDPDFQRNADRFQPNFAPFAESQQQSGMYMQRSYNSEFPSLGPASSGPLRHPMAGMAPLGLPTLPSGVPTASGGNSLGMSYPGMPLMGPQMVLPSMAPDGTLMSPNGMHGYQAHMQPFPYMFPGMGHAGMQINPMQGYMFPHMQYGMPIHQGVYPGMAHAPRPGTPLDGNHMMSQTPLPMYGAYPQQQGGLMAAPRPSVGPLGDRGGRGPSRNGSRGFPQGSSASSSAALRRQSSTGSSASSLQVSKAPSAPSGPPPPSIPAPSPPTSKPPPPAVSPSTATSSS